MAVPEQKAEGGQHDASVVGQMERPKHHDHPSHRQQVAASGGSRRYQSARTGRSQLRTRMTNRQPQGLPQRRAIVDGMEEVRFEAPEAACLGGYRIFGRSMHRTLMLEVVGIGGHPGAGGSHCRIPHLKPDK
jgi:hypothetical protein